MDVEKTPAPPCTCPSGDGSLRSPCPAHGALPGINLQHEALGFVLFPLSPAAIAPHVVEYIIGFDFDEVRDVYGKRFAVFWQGLVDMLGRVPPLGVGRYQIENAPGLDPITVYAENYEPGKGRMVVTCYASAWTAFWGSMGADTTLEQFVASCSPEYVADNMVWGANTVKSSKGHADKVAAAVVALFKSQRDAAPGESDAT